MDKKSKIIKVKKNTNGDIIDVMIENGDIYSINEVTILAQYGLLEGVNISDNKSLFIDNPNNTISEIFDNFPLF